ncbi:Protein spinster 1 [Amphibalanus amphitrite]|uniref:Protein spinster 1 n=1 Tax=Amphibalanus amphitrite TaxID=1232801 RepID=A0A6A4WTH2_AMPAM|nr:Protein spinster 1 [Amphibalanus amphitrite]
MVTSEGGSEGARAPRSGGGPCALLRQSPYSLYVLLLLMAAYLLSKMDRYMLAVVVRPSAQEIHFGDRGCLLNVSADCVTLTDPAGAAGCSWDYTGTGLQYDLLAGPVFTLVFTVAGLPLGLAADRCNRKLLLCACLLVWAVCVLLTGLAQQYWQLAALRFGVGFGEAGCTPLATSLLADYFSPELRGTALGVYNWGIYFGYSLAYAVGDFITEADIMGMGWRWAYFVSGAPGVLLALLMLATLREPPRAHLSAPPAADSARPAARAVPRLLRLFARPPVLLLALAGSVRNAAVYVWSYSTETFFESQGQTAAQVGAYMSWVPLVSGPLGLLLGGLVSDGAGRRLGPAGRLGAVAASQLLAAPFVVGVLFLRPPWAYISIIPSYIIGELWFPISLVVLVELTPAELRNAAVAFYIFVITNIGGNMQLLLKPLMGAFQRTGRSYLQAYRGALFVLFPGQYVLAACLYLAALVALKAETQRHLQQKDANDRAKDLSGVRNLAFQDE